MTKNAIPLILAVDIATASSATDSGQKRASKPRKAKATVQTSAAKVVETPVYLWECRHCGEQVEGMSMPSTNHCHSDTYHSWVRKSRVE